MSLQLPRTAVMRAETGSVHRARPGRQGRPHHRRRLDRALVAPHSDFEAYAASPRFFSKPSIFGGRPRKAT